MKTRLPFLFRSFLFIVLGGLSLALVLKDQKAVAEVNQIDGVYVFVMSTPKVNYEVLGTVKGPGIYSHEFGDLNEKIIQRAKKKFPQTEGIIYSSEIKQSHNTSAIAIRFKE